MIEKRLEDVRDTAVKLGDIYSKSPTDYAYLKGWIHCLLQKEYNNIQSHEPPNSGSSVMQIRRT